MRRPAKVAACLAALCQAVSPVTAFAQTAPMVTPQPDPGPEIAPYVVAPTAPMDRAALIRDLRAKVKYVFVIFNENHSFDNEFGTFPGANGLYSDGQSPRSAAQMPGFTQTYTGADGKPVTVQPFRIGPEQNATFVDSVDHSHVGLAHKLDVKNGVHRHGRLCAG